MARNISGNGAGDLHVIIKLDNRAYAIPVGLTREMVVMPPITQVPRLPEYVRGVINLRGKVMPLLDLRLKLGMLSCLREREDLGLMMQQREEDHTNWLNELEESVTQGREFTLAKDPRSCAFGKWYYSFDFSSLTSRCALLGSALKKFEEPHNRIHAVADQVLGLAGSGDQAGALAMIEETRHTTLAEMVKLFRRARHLIEHETREIAIVLGQGENSLAVAVDNVEAVEKLSLGQATRASGLGLQIAEEAVEAVADRARGGEMVLVLNMQRILPESLAVGAA